VTIPTPPQTPQTSAPVPASPPVATAPPAAAPIVPSAPAVDPSSAAAADERINDLIGRYKEALESKNLDQLKRLWPSLTGGAESAIRQEFRQATRITVDISDPHISVSGGAGKVSFVRKYSLVTVEGQRLQSTSTAVMDVRRAGNAWVIDAIRFTPR
jgi:hypothetical protein